MPWYDEEHFWSDLSKKNQQLILLKPVTNVLWNGCLSFFDKLTKICFIMNTQKKLAFFSLLLNNFFKILSKMFFFFSLGFETKSLLFGESLITFLSYQFEARAWILSSSGHISKIQISFSNSGVGKKHFA